MTSSQWQALKTSSLPACQDLAAWKKAREVLNLALQGGGTEEGTAVILSDFNYHIPAARMQGRPTHWFSQQEPARGKLGGKLWKSSLCVPKFMDGQAVKFRPHLNALLLFLDLLLLLFAWGPNEFRTARCPFGPGNAHSRDWIFLVPSKRCEVSW